MGNNWLGSKSQRKTGEVASCARVTVKSWMWLLKRQYHFGCVDGTTKRPKSRYMLKLVMERAITSCFLCVR